MDRNAEEIRLIDIALLPEYRNQGIGSCFLKEILSEASSTGLPVHIHVEVFNESALRLYRRLGFQEIATQGVHLLLEWSPDSNLQT